MRGKSRRSAAEIYAGVFVGEVRRLNRRASQAHLAVLALITFAFAFAFCSIVFSPFWIPKEQTDVVVIERLDQTEPVSGRAIDLPHQKIPKLAQQQEHSYRSLFDWQAGENAALYIPTHFNQLTVHLNGVRLLARDVQGDNPLSMWRRASFYLIPDNLLVGDGNEIVLKLLGQKQQLLDLSQLYVGPQQLLLAEYERRQFFSLAVLWVMLAGAVWSALSTLVLHFVGGGRFLLAAMPVSWMIVFQSILQLSDSSWISPVVHTLIWYVNGLIIVFGGLMFSHSQWRSTPAFRGLVFLLIVLSLLAVIKNGGGFVDAAVLSWWAAFTMCLMVALLMTVLVIAAVRSIYREESLSLHPFLTQVVHSRLVVSLSLWVVLLSMVGWIAQVPMVLINIAFIMMSINSSIVALISAIARTQELLEYRGDLEAKLQQQEQLVCRMDHEHLEAMRWSVIGQSALTLVEEIKSPLARMSNDLAILRMDPAFAEHQKQWSRLKHCADRCSEHVRVIESLVSQDTMQLVSFRMDSFVERSMATLQESYVFDWSLRASVRGWIEADEHYLFCVIENLVDNAQHSADAAGRRLHLQITMDQEDDFLILGFQDNGLGIEKPEDVFQAFHTSKAFGLGLGVNLAQKHLNGMGGYLSLLPCDTGAKFCVCLPKGTRR